MASNFFPSHLHDSEEEDDPSHDAEEESDSVDGGDEDEDEEEHEEDPMNPSRPRHLYYAPLRVTPMASNFSPSPFHGSEEEDDPSHDAEEESDSVDGGDEEEDEEEHEEDEDEEEYEEEEEDEEEDEEDEDEEDEGEDEDFGLSVNSDEPATLPAESIGYPLEVASRVDQEEGFLEIPAILNDDGARGGRGEEEGEGGGEEERGDVEMVDVECCDKKDDGGVLQSSDGVELDRSMLPTCLICFEPWTSEGAHRIW